MSDQQVTVDVPPSLAGLLMLLPPPVSRWDEAARDRWLAALRENLELNYPVRTANLNGKIL